MKRSIMVLLVMMVLVGISAQSSFATQGDSQVSADQQIPTLNINTATAAEFKSLPGVGTVTAQKIVDYREKIQIFSKIEQLMEVKGIGAKSFEKIRELVSIE